MSLLFLIITLLFIVVSAVMVLIILVQRPQGGGLVGAFGGAGGGGTETVFGGRVGDALTWATVGAFVLYLGIAISLNQIDSSDAVAAETDTEQTTTTPPSTEPSIEVQGGEGGEGGAGIELREPVEGEQLPPELIEQLQRQQSERPE